MAGRYGARGYVYQSIIAVLRCLEDDDWELIKVEPLTKRDKVDIILKKSGIVLKAIQVKSSVNKFEKPEIKNWLRDLCDDIESEEYELVLVGNGYTEPALRYIEKINRASDNIQIEKVDFNEKTLFKLIKLEIIEFLERYGQLYSIKDNGIGNVARCLLADLMLISTNEDFYNKEQLIHLINENIFYDNKSQGRSNAIKQLLKIAVFCSWVLLSYDAVKISLINSIFVSLSDIFVLIVWGLMKYSDDCYRNKSIDEPYEHHSSQKEFGQSCPFLEVGISINNILFEQEIEIKNICDIDIAYIKGELTFYSYNREVYNLKFEKKNIEKGKIIRIDKISYKTTVEYTEKVLWDEVNLKIIRLDTMEEKNISWKGKIIKFFRILDLKPIRYLQIGSFRILPYEMSWLYEKVIRKNSRLVFSMLHAQFGGYDLRNSLNNIKIKVYGFFKRWFYHIIGVIMLLLLMGGMFIILRGQYLIFYNLFK